MKVVLKVTCAYRFLLPDTSYVKALGQKIFKVGRPLEMPTW